MRSGSGNRRANSSRDRIGAASATDHHEIDAIRQMIRPATDFLDNEIAYFPLIACAIPARYLLVPGLLVTLLNTTF